MDPGDGAEAAPGTTRAAARWVGCASCSARDGRGRSGLALPEAGGLAKSSRREPSCRQLPPEPLHGGLQPALQRNARLPAEQRARAGDVRPALALAVRVGRVLG